MMIYKNQLFVLLGLGEGSARARERAQKSAVARALKFLVGNNREGKKMDISQLGVVKQFKKSAFTMLPRRSAAPKAPRLPSLRPERPSCCYYEVGDFAGFFVTVPTYCGPAG